ncbi:helix-turn-helix transcriptional regulator [Allokutzneria albata]|uniref:Regulatory protein, luxR family n=1 Tax=Allokutzneria albata TaxID=211114 RepID=A0A1G9TIH3_ALLAB|nr:LuxR family transcriptional regulator [Allokutzneria albata]SDM47422.1 regulatory protein, luxR family [Allokutzneria albata]
MSVVGRENEIAEVLGLTSGTLVVSGDPGAGKSTLLDLAAEAHSGRVLRVAGGENEANLPFAALHQLVRPMLAEAGELPPRQRAALLGAFGIGDEEAPDRLLINVAVLTLLSGHAEREPVLVVVDDAQWLDGGSLDALMFLARRIEDEPLAILVGTRDDSVFAGFRRCALAPLDRAAANRLLDAQPRSPQGRERVRILDQAAGNPLALVELARTEGADQDVLPLTDRLERIFAAHLDELPEPTRAALLLVAVDTADLLGARYAADLAPAELAGLIKITQGRVRFRHPLVRSAIQHAAPMEQRIRAHRTLAELLREEPDRRAWHLAAASTGPDEDVAAALESTARRARQRGGYAAAATALERAAELSPDRAARARRLVRAADMAALTGHARWVEQLATQASSLTDDPDLRARAALRLGQVLTMTIRFPAAYELLMRTADDAAPALAKQALASAASIVFYAGSDQWRRQVREHSAADDPLISAVTDPHENRSELVAVLPELVDAANGNPRALNTLGVMAWMLDENATAMRIYDDALHRLRAAGDLPDGLGCSASWAYLDGGRWAQARQTGTSSVSSVDEADMPHLVAGTYTLEAVASALSGNAAEARELALRALSIVDPQDSRAISTRARCALGMAAVVDGDHEAAYEQFRQLFTAEGDPVHYHCSYPGIGELAAAAVRIGRHQEAAEVVERAAKRLEGRFSARTSALVSRARALLAEPEEAESHFEAALADPAGEQWPFERAQILLDYAEWLRRRRRITEARPKLNAAMEIFQRLGARPWIDRAQGELRAAGIEGNAQPSALSELSPQQQTIVRMAARGLTNKEIGERLFLSPRTVSSHLYRSFPKLGITARSQLRDLVDGAG